MAQNVWESCCLYRPYYIWFCLTINPHASLQYAVVSDYNLISQCICLCLTIFGLSGLSHYTSTYLPTSQCVQREEAVDRYGNVQRGMGRCRGCTKKQRHMDTSRVSLPHYIWFYPTTSPHTCLYLTIRRHQETWPRGDRNTKI